MHLLPVGGVIAGRFYLVGGSVNSAPGPNLQLHVYNPANNSWTPQLPLPSKQQMGAGAALNGRLYVAGGYDYTAFDFIASLRVHNPGANAWSSMAPMLTPRMYAAGVNAGGKLWVISGNGATGKSTKVEAYSP